MAIPGLRVPGNSPSGQPLQPQSGGNPTEEAFGAGIGRGLQALGQGAFDAGTRLDQVAEAAQRVKVLRNYTDFNTRVNNYMEELQNNAPLDTQDLQAQAESGYRKMEEEFLGSVPDRFQDEFKVRTSELGVGVSNQARTVQGQLNDAYFTSAAQEQYNVLSSELGLDPSITNLELKRAQLNELLDAADISAPRREQLRMALEPGLEKIAYRQQWVDQLMQESLGLAGATPTAIDLIEQFDGGTDDENEILVSAAQDVAIEDIGGDTWDALPARARGALMSLVADLGSVPESVVVAAQNGDLVGLAKAVAELGGERRQAEAERILSIGPEELGVDANPSFNNISYEDRVNLRRDAETEVNAAMAAQAKLQLAANNARINGLMVGLYDGTAGLTEIDDAREAGWLTDYEDINRAHTIYEKRNEDVALAGRVQSVLDNGGTFDPTSEDDKKALNAFVGQKGLQALQNMDGEFATNFLLPLVSKGGDVPTDVAGTLTGMARNKDQTKALWAIDLMAQIQEVAPEAFSQRFNAQIESDVNFWNTRKDYMPQDELMKVINGGFTTEQVSRTKLLRQEAAEKMRTDPSIQADLVKQLGGEGWFGTNASLPPTDPWTNSAMNADFAMLFQDEYAKYGSVEEAKKGALAMMKRVWGPTTVGGGWPKLMRYPPELQYPAMAGSHDWIKQQVYDEGIILPTDQFELIADDQTEAEVDAAQSGGPPPSYILVRLRDGVPYIQTGLDGRPMRQYFSVTDEVRRQERVWRKAREAEFTQADLERALGNAMDNSLSTGMPTPEDAYQGMGIAEYFMQEDGNAAASQ